MHSSRMHSACRLTVSASIMKLKFKNPSSKMPILLTFKGHNTSPSQDQKSQPPWPGVKDHNTSPGQGQRSQHLPPRPGSKVTTPPPAQGQRSQHIPPGHCQRSQHLPPGHCQRSQHLSPSQSQRSQHLPQPESKVITPPPPGTMHRQVVCILLEFILVNFKICSTVVCTFKSM